MAVVSRSQSAALAASAPMGPPRSLWADARARFFRNRAAVAGLVILRQRPGTAKGVVFITLEDETGIANVVVWRNVYERFRRAVVAGRALRVTGRLQRQSGVAHVVADRVEDISWMLDSLAQPPARDVSEG